MPTAHDFDFTSIDGKPMPMQGFDGKAVLVVNTASRCGLTPQYEGLESLWAAYRDKGLVVLGVPSNDFGAQEPGTESEIQSFCTTNFGVDFPMTAKVPVTGAAAHPFYQWAKAELGDEAEPRWNFHKILVGKDGRLVRGFGSRTEPSDPELIAAIDAAL
ncbi:MAG TPA: glutathione peroxidase [Caulobacteraceae bacterium]|jgi:glutathione peroxidase|nr:glutathione peroxidase [Caulobacteraceae bacterium]